MRRFLSLLLAFAISFTALPAHAAEIPETFTFAGAGWGHGVGMSQYGAYGMAREGKTEQEIVQYFYPGTTVLPVKDDAILRVNLLFQATKATIRLSGAEGAQMQIFAGDNPALDAAAVGSVVGNQTLNVINDGANLALSVTSSEISTRIPSGTTFTIRWSGTRYLPGVDGWARIGTTASAPLYRYGQLVLKSTKVGSGFAFNLSNDVRIHDEYLKGIAEMPSSWPAAALKAQALSARSFALNRYGTGKLNSTCFCHVYDSQKDQRFAGYAKEAEANWGAKWVAAVTETATDESNGLAITNAGAPIAAYFFSSSGGRTQEISEVWGSKVPWLVSVPDPWSVDPTINPSYASWIRTVSQAVMAKAFNLPDVVSVSFPTRTVGGGIKSAIATSSTGQTATLTGEVFRSRTALPSTYLGRSVARITAPDAAQLATAVAKIAQPTGTTAVLADDGATDIITAVAASSLAGSLQQPLFFLHKKKLPGATLNELKLRKIAIVNVVGTREIVPDAVLRTLQKNGIKVKRIASTSYTATASMIAKQRTGAPILVSSQDPELAAAIAGVARRDDRPVLFVSPTGPTPTTLATLRSMSGRTLTIVGRTTSIPDTWVSKISEVISVDDRRGDDLGVLATSLADDPLRLLLANSASEALAASAFNQSVLITATDQLSPAAVQWISARSLAQITIIGSTISDAVLESLKRN